MPRLGAKQTLKVYSLVLFWSVFIFWAGFMLGTREALPGEGQDRAHQPSPRPVLPSNRGVPDPAFVDSQPVLNLVRSEMSGDAGEAKEEELSMVAADRAFHTVQIGAVKTEAEGRQLLMKLEAKGHHGHLVPPSDSGVFYRVWVGEWAGESQAKQMEQLLKSDGFSTYVRKRGHPQLR